MSRDELSTALINVASDIKPILQENFDSHTKTFLLHPFIGDVRRFCLAAFERSQFDLLQKCLQVLERGLLQGDEEVENAIAVSFIEDTGWWDPAMAEFMSTWPPALRSEVNRQRAWRSRE